MPSKEEILAAIETLRTALIARCTDAIDGLEDISIEIEQDRTYLWSDDEPVTNPRDPEELADFLIGEE